MAAQLKPGGEPEPADTITVLKSAGPLLTKIFDADQVIPYDSAKNFSIETLPVSGISSLSSMLKMLETKGRRCVIRGRFIGDAKAQSIAPPEKPGMYPRISSLFDEVPHHWLMTDIDHYACVLYDPATEPEEAVHEFILDKMPPEFHEVSYHWQISSSAGRTPGMLKCHIWWWLATPYTGPQLKAWVRANQLPIDVAPLRKVQVHYVANPIFRNGAVDPVAARSGLYRGLSDSVGLDLPDDVLGAGEEKADLSGDIDLVDPTTKPGVIGAFCRAYPITRVINELLPEEFIFAIGSDRRVTWQNSGGGAPEGCFITDDDWYLGNTHNTDPFDGRLANAWDLVRHFKFGALDASLTDDERALYSINELPSHKAMVEWAEALPELTTDVVTEALAARAVFEQEIQDTPDEATLRGRVAARIKSSRDLERTDREHLAELLKRRIKTITTVAPAIGDMRALVMPSPNDQGLQRGAPTWLSPWVYVIDSDKFFNLENKELASKQGFDVLYNHTLMAFSDENGNVPSASRMCADVWGVATVSHLVYLPGFAQTFEMMGRRWANRYREGSIPQAVPVLTDSEAGLMQKMLALAELQFPEARERNLFLDYLAHNIQHPGTKIRWAPFVHGVPGDGKTFWYEILGACMGAENVKIVNASTLTSDFTGWAMGAALICVEESMMHGHNKWDTANKMKPYVTNNSVEIHAKGKDPFNMPNCSNFMVLSNFEDGIPLDRGDRRWFVVGTDLGTERAIELTEAGVFSEMFDAVRDYPGAFRRWFLDRQVSAEFDPNGRAPMTEGKARTIELSKSDMQLAAEDIVFQQATGITTDIIATDFLTDKLEQRFGEKPKGRSVKTLLTRMNYKGIVERPFWRGMQRTIYASDEMFRKMAKLEDKKAFVIAHFEANDFDDQEFLK